MKMEELFGIMKQACGLKNTKLKTERKRQYARKNETN